MAATTGWEWDVDELIDDLGVTERRLERALDAGSRQVVDPWRHLAMILRLEASRSRLRRQLTEALNR